MVLVEWWDDCDMVGIESCSTKNLERLVESRTTGRVLGLYHGLGGSSCEGLVRPSHCVHSSKRPYNQRNGERVDAFRSRQAPIVAILA